MRGIAALIPKEPERRLNSNILVETPIQGRNSWSVRELCFQSRATQVKQGGPTLTATDHAMPATMWRSRPIISIPKTESHSTTGKISDKSTIFNLQNYHAHQTKTKQKKSGKIKSRGAQGDTDRGKSKCCAREGTLMMKQVLKEPKMHGDWSIL